MNRKRIPLQSQAQVRVALENTTANMQVKNKINMKPLLNLQRNLAPKTQA
jgi:hypothetical protein